MIWNSTSDKAKAKKRAEWSAWFAWHPIRVDEQMVWLERVERKNLGAHRVFWFYRLPRPKKLEVVKS